MNTFEKAGLQLRNMWIPVTSRRDWYHGAYNDEWKNWILKNIDETEIREILPPVLIFQFSEDSLDGTNT